MAKFSRVIVFCVMLGLSSFFGLQARVQDERDLQSFMKGMRKSNTGLVAALFYFSERNDDKAIRKRIKDYRDNFDRVSKQESIVSFMSANLARASAEEIKRQYYDDLGLGKDSSPVIILFKNSSPDPVRDKQGNIPMLGGFVSQDQIRDFLYATLGDDIKKAIKEEIKERRERRERSWYYAPYFNAGWGYPWGYGYYPYWRWGW